MTGQRCIQQTAAPVPGVRSAVGDTGTRGSHGTARPRWPSHGPAQRGVAPSRVPVRPAPVASGVSVVAPAAPVRLLLRACACGCSPDSESCEKADGRQVRRSADAAAVGGVLADGEVDPRIESEIDGARGGGSPLEPTMREGLEVALGGSLADVRIHTDARAGSLASALSARAFAAGRDVFFASGEYRPGSGPGDTLLAHEIAHVAQQRGSAVHGRFTVSRPGDAIEREADQLAGELQSHVRGTLRTGLAQMTAGRPTLARQAAEAEPEGPPPLRVIPGGRSDPEGGPIDVPESDDWLPDPGDASFEAALQRMNIRSYGERMRRQQERPVATMDRGGKAPGFITVEGTRLFSWLGGPGGGGSVTVRNRSFHVADAIDYEVDHANNEDALDAIVNRYLPNVSLVNRGIDALARGRRPDIWQIQPAPYSIFDSPVFTPDFDPGGLARAKVLEAAIDRRAQQVPALARSRLAPRSRRQGGCRIEPMDVALGDDPLSALYCHLATGSPYSYRITIESSTGGLTQRWAEIDSLRGNTWYECKCGYEALLSGEAKGDAVARAVLDKLDHQVLNHLDIARTCGLDYRYIVSSERVADILRSRWFGNVIINVVPFQSCE